MGNVQASADIKSAELSAVIIRADGTREDLGTIASYHKNPVKRLLKKFNSDRAR
jgi:hypothetical protein